MVFKRSEYRKQYKDPIWNCHFPHYKEKVDYRIYRRRMEHHHQIFDWDSSDSENGQGDVGAAPTAPINKNNNQGQGNDRRVPHHTDDPQKLSEMCLEQKKKSKEEPDTPQPDQVLQLVKPLRHKKPKTQRVGRTTADRPHTSPGGKRLDVGKERAPMIAFGWADRELETGSKKTHNIRASADPLQIYPSALRAMRRRELDIQRQQEQEKQSRKEQKLRALFNIQPRDDTTWTTEYRRNFIGPSR